MEDDMEGLGCIINRFSRWMGTTLFKEWRLNLDARLGCKPRGNKTRLLIFYGHLSFYTSIWNMRHCKRMKVGHIGLLFKHNSKLWNSIKHNAWNSSSPLRRGQPCWGWPCQTPINLTLILKMIKHIPLLGVKVLWLVWTHWIPHLLSVTNFLCNIRCHCSHWWSTTIWPIGTKFSSFGIGI